MYRERYDDSNIMGELFLRPDCTFEQVRQIIAEVSATPGVESRVYLPALLKCGFHFCLRLSCRAHCHGEFMCHVRIWVKMVRFNWFMAI